MGVLDTKCVSLYVTHTSHIQFVHAAGT